MTEEEFSTIRKKVRDGFQLWQVILGCFGRNYAGDERDRRLCDAGASVKT